MSANLDDFIKFRPDSTLMAALPKLVRGMKLGNIEDYDEDVLIELPIGAVADALELDAVELGAAAKAGLQIDPKKFALIRNRLLTVNKGLQSAVAKAPATASILQPLSKVVSASRNIVGAAANTALQLRTAAQIRHLRRANNQTTVHVLNLADGATTGTYRIKAPVSGRPFRFMAMTTEVGTVGSSSSSPSRGPIGVGFASFNILGNERVSVSNVELSTGTLATARWDFTQFSKLNEDKEPEEKIYPWGIGASGWFESDFTFTFTVINGCGLPVNATITFFWQASPCDDETDGRGIYRAEPRKAIPIMANRSAQLFRNVAAFSPHPVAVSGYEDMPGADF